MVDKARPVPGLWYVDLPGFNPLGMYISQGDLTREINQVIDHEVVQLLCAIQPSTIDQ
jgi:hypothetical protein